MFIRGEKKEYSLIWGTVSANSRIGTLPPHPGLYTIFSLAQDDITKPGA